MEKESRAWEGTSGEDPLEVLRSAQIAASGREEEEPPPSEASSEQGGGANAMRRKRVRSWRLWGGIVLLLVLLALGLGYRYAWWRVSRQGDASQRTARTVYYCPMHPEYRSERPGECPICGMTLVPLESASEGRAPEHAPSSEMGAGAFPPGTVHISPIKQQLIGVAYGEVAFGPVVHTIRAVGKVTYDETKIARVHPKIEGWIERVHVDYVGKFVRKGQPLVEIYSPELVATQQEYLLALRAKETLSRSSYPEIASSAHSLYEASKKRLELWDIPEEDIRRIHQRGQPSRTLTLYAPVTGFVLARQAFERQRVTPETELYVIADLSTVWVVAEIYEYEAPMLRVGQRATMTLPYLPGRIFHGRVAYIYPQVDATTRTVKIRLEFPNPALALKPDMYANVQVHVSYGRRLWVPEGAVLDSGEEQIVFVAHEGGYFEPRRVRVGPKVGDRYIILEGLRAGERIVTSGTFLIDSESRLKSALQGIGPAEQGRAPEAPAKRSPQHAGHTP